MKTGHNVRQSEVFIMHKSYISRRVELRIVNWSTLLLFGQSEILSCRLWRDFVRTMALRLSVTMNFNSIAILQLVTMKAEQ